MLNSNEQFEMDDSFQLSLTQTQVETRSFCLDVLQEKKLSVLLIKNGDKLCCARAIVTAKAGVEQHPNCDGFKRGRRIQAEHAVDLHHKTRVPRGPCGYDELQAFSLASSLYDYQILLCDATRGYVVTSFGPPSQKQLVLLYDDGHYDVITSLPGFFGTSYFCLRCLKPYDNQGPHACDNNPDHCSAYLKTGCPDYTEAQCRSLPASSPLPGRLVHARPFLKLLKQGCLSFKSVFKPLARFKPFSHITIASACNQDLRHNRMEADTIANESLHGWRLNRNHSCIALEWVHWQQHQLPDEDDYIRHVGNSGKYQIPHSRYTVDRCHEKTNTVYEFQGHFWHGCPVCYSNRTESHCCLDNRCFDDVYRCTQVKLDLLRNRGFRVVEIWECQWENMRKYPNSFWSVLPSVLTQIWNAYDLRTQSVAFPDHSQRALKRLHEQVAQDQERGQRVA